MDHLAALGIGQRQLHGVALLHAQHGAGHLLVERPVGEGGAVVQLAHQLHGLDALLVLLRARGLHGGGHGTGVGGNAHGTGQGRSHCGGRRVQGFGTGGVLLHGLFGFDRGAFDLQLAFHADLAVAGDGAVVAEGAGLGHLKAQRGPCRHSPSWKPHSGLRRPDRARHLRRSGARSPPCRPLRPRWWGSPGPWRSHRPSCRRRCWSSVPLCAPGRWRLFWRLRRRVPPVHCRGWAPDSVPGRWRRQRGSGNVSRSYASPCNPGNRTAVPRNLGIASAAVEGNSSEIQRTSICVGSSAKWRGAGQPHKPRRANKRSAISLLCPDDAPVCADCCYQSASSWRRRSTRPGAGPAPVRSRCAAHGPPARAGS